MAREEGIEMRKMDKKGFTLVEIMIVVAIIGLLAAIAIPNFVSARRAAATQADVANVRTLQAAVEMYRADTGILPTAVADLAGYLRGGVPTSPTPGVVYSIDGTGLVSSGAGS